MAGREQSGAEVWRREEERAARDSYSFPITSQTVPELRRRQDEFRVFYQQNVAAKGAMNCSFFLDWTRSCSQYFAHNTGTSPLNDQEAQGT